MGNKANQLSIKIKYNPKDYKKFQRNWKNKLQGKLSQQSSYL